VPRRYDQTRRTVDPQDLHLASNNVDPAEHRSGQQRRRVRNISSLPTCFSPGRENGTGRDHQRVAETGDRAVCQIARYVRLDRKSPSGKMTRGFFYFQPLHHPYLQRRRAIDTRG